VRSIRAVRRYSVLLAILMVLLLAAVPRLRALTDEEKKQQFVDSRGDTESSASPTPHHKKHADAEPTPRHKHSPTPESEETPHHKHSPTPEPEETPHHKRLKAEAEGEKTPTRKHHHPSPTPEATVRKHSHPQGQEEETPAPVGHPETPSPTPRVAPMPEQRPAHTLSPQPYQSYQQTYQPYGSATSSIPSPIPRATPTPPPANQGASGAQVNIEKEGLEQEGGFVPPPPPPPAHRHWWQVFGGEEEPQYHYLTKAIRDAIDRAPVARHRWRFIVVHNSGTRQGNARIFDYYHLHVRKMPNGLAYHFVIGNGTSSGNGQIEIGNRWIRQINGGHVHSDYLNNIALGICLVGDFNRDLPTREQLEALDELIRYLRIRVGKIDRKPAIVKAHKEINPPQWPTDCPGDKFPYYWLHSRFD